MMPETCVLSKRSLGWDYGHGIGDPIEYCIIFLPFQVRTLKMHFFTLIQILCLIILWVVKSTQAALAFPFFLLLLVPLRLQILPRFFSEKELKNVRQRSTSLWYNSNIVIHNVTFRTTPNFFYDEFTWRVNLFMISYFICFNMNMYNIQGSQRQGYQIDVSRLHCKLNFHCSWMEMLRMNPIQRKRNLTSTNRPTCQYNEEEKYPLKTSSWMASLYRTPSFLWIMCLI